MRTKKTFLNFITDVVPLAIISFLGIYKLKIFINVLGNETLGLYQLYSQIMVYIALVDGGLGSALLYSLYKPNSSKDDEKFNAIIAGAYRIFALIGIIIFGITLLASPFISLFIKNSVFSNQYLMITFLCFSLSNIVEYFFVPYRTIFEVKEKKYIVNICLQVGQIILSVTEIIMLLLGFNFILILLMHSVIKLLSNIVIAILCRKIYPNIKMNSKNRDYGFTKQLKHLVFHKINGLVSYNIDVIIISKILSYKIDKVIIYPYGGFVKLNTKINTKIENDLLVAISGIIMQSIYFGIIFFLYRNGIVREYIYSLFLLYHKSMLIFNLLPIYPLDGAKIVNLILSKYFSFNIANYISIVISFITVVFFLYSDIYENNYSIILVIGVLMKNIYKFYKDISYIYNRFILERYLFKFNYKKKVIIKNKDKMYKNRVHIFNDNGKLMNEKEYISTFFEKKP